MQGYVMFALLPKPIASLSTTKPINISDCVDIVPIQGIFFEAMFTLGK